MNHFFDALRVSILPEEGKAILSVRANENRVDEYYLPVEVVREMIETYQESPESWAGPDLLRVRVDTVVGLVGLSIAVGEFKREVYRVRAANFGILVAQFRAQTGRG